MYMQEMLVVVLERQEACTTLCPPQEAGEELDVQADTGGGRGGGRGAYVDV